MANPYGLSSHQMVTGASANNDSIDDDQQAQRLLLQQNHLLTSQQTIDVRMKRHPELQPFVPSDRDKLSTSFITKLSNSNPGKSSSNNNKQLQAATNNHTANKYTPMNDNNMDAKSSNTKPKKCVSMTRLDQLAKPKKIFTKDTDLKRANQVVPSSSLLSSSTTSTATSSLTHSRNYNSRPQNTKNLTQTLRQAKTALRNNDPQPKKQIANKPPPPTTTIVQQQKPTNQRQSKPKQQRQQQPADNSKEALKKSAQFEELKNDETKVLVKAAVPERQDPAPQNDIGQMKPVDGIPDLSSESLININPQTEPINSPVVEPTPLITPDSKINNHTFDSSRRLSRGMEVGRSLFEELHGDTSALSSIPNQESSRRFNESSIVEQMSEVSINDVHFQSANSDLTYDGENSTNGVLINNGNLEALTPTASLTPTNTDVLFDFDRSQLDSSSISKVEQEIKEAARREEEARKKRESIVEGIMSKVKQSF